MSFCIHVPRFLRENRILCGIKNRIERFAVEETVFLFLLGAFPLFQLLPHPTLSLLVLTAFLLALHTLTVLCQASVFLDLCDLFVLGFLLLQISTALTGMGRGSDALAAALFTSVWFPARRFFRAGGTQRFVLFSSCSLLLTSVIGVGEYLFGRAELRWVDATRFAGIGGRVTSLFSNPNILAVYLLLMLPLPLGAAFSRHKKGKGRVFYAIAASFAAACLFFTWSRGAWLGLFCEVAIIVLLHSPKTRKLALAAAPLLLLAIPFLPRSVRGRLFSIGDLYESSNRYRLHTWQGTLQMLASHPFGIGVGERAWRTVYPHYALSGTATVMHAHNIFLQVAVELGAVGLVLFLSILAISVWRAFHRGALAPAAAVCGTLIMGSFDHLWYFPAMLLPLCTVLAMCCETEQKEGQKNLFVDILHEK